MSDSKFYNQNIDYTLSASGNADTPSQSNPDTQQIIKKDSNAHTIFNPQNNHILSNPSFQKNND